jgi:hypothetical protein
MNLFGFALTLIPRAGTDSKISMFFGSVRYATVKSFRSSTRRAGLEGRPGRLGRCGCVCDLSGGFWGRGADQSAGEADGAEVIVGVVVGSFLGVSIEQDGKILYERR